VKKIQGDISALRNQLQQALEIDEADIKINQLTRHIIIKVRTNMHASGGVSYMLFGLRWAIGQ